TEPRSTVDNPWRRKSTPSGQRADRVAASSLGKLMVLRRRCYAQMLGDPAIKIGKRPGAQRLLLGYRLLVAAQPRAIRFLGRQARKWREKTEIDVHRLERACGGFGGIDVVAGGIVEKRGLSRWCGWWFGG